MWCSFLTVFFPNYRRITMRTKTYKRTRGLKCPAVAMFRTLINVAYVIWLRKRAAMCWKKNPIHNWTFSYLRKRNKSEFEFFKCNGCWRVCQLKILSVVFRVKHKKFANERQLYLKNMNLLTWKFSTLVSWVIVLNKNIFTDQKNHKERINPLLTFFSNKVGQFEGLFLLKYHCKT